MTTIADILNDLKVEIKSKIITENTDDSEIDESFEQAQDSINDLLDRVKGE